MKQYSTFHFSGYSWNHHAGKISLKYSLDRSVDFEELVLLPEAVTDERLKAREWEIERMLFALHLIGGISYYKTCLPRAIKVESGELGKAEGKFWNTVYEKGLGEFFFRNTIDFRGLVKFPETKKAAASLPAMRKKHDANPLKRILVPIGGGKDSVVTAELLKKSGANVTLLRMEPHPLVDELVHALGLPMITVRRQLSPVLFDLNKSGALNGHVPVTAYLSILSVLIAILYDYDAVVMSNERSADEGNVEYKGLTVNHQWSKSLEFEKMLRRHIAETVIDQTEYFSLLRPLSELRIAEIFAGYPQYFTRFSSCNRNWVITGERPDTRWCGACPKCAFVYSCMAAFLPKKELITIFGSDFFGNEALLPLFRELLGIEKFKPLECVGTPEETKAAFLLAHRRGELKGTPVMTMFEKEVLPSIKNGDALIAACLAPSGDHCVPASLLPLLS
jgi:UDP-N-acetyl-alpha-D-muramoyl-L-alanyl-L-glutamate epimerase